MHGLVNTSIERFLRRAYGNDRWQAVASAAGLGIDTFEPMMSYDDSVTEAVLDAASAQTGLSRADLLEDLGTFLVSDTSMEPLRRLLRFGGDDYTEFLHSLDDLPDRVRLAVPELQLPRIESQEVTPGLFRLSISPGWPGIAHVFAGVLRTMADDYGALVMLDHRGERRGCDEFSIAVVEKDFATGRSFALGTGWT